MSKRLIICCDGTWNYPDQKGGATNVVKMVRAIEPADENDRPQVVYYDPGVGTGNWLDRLIGGSFGIGLSQNVQDAYQFLVNNYEEGDTIFLFGFSRGAFTVRSLAGLIGCVGLLRKGDMDRFADAYKYYKTKPAKRGTESAQALLNGITGRKHPPIEMVGVWDTVGSLGVPFGFLRWIGQTLYNFHDLTLGKHIRHGYHALAIDERRRPFRPTLWDKPKDPGDGSNGQVVEQVWFAGAHSNVGGGYPDRGLSDIAFLWMAAKAKRLGLKLDRDYIMAKIEKDLKSSRRVLVNSRTLKYWIWLPWVRPLCAGETERVHQSVIERWETTHNGTPPTPYDPYPYKPRNLERLRKRVGKLERLVVDTETLFELDVAPPTSSPEKKQQAVADAKKM